LSVERRRRLVELANEYRVPIVEDDAYGELRYSGEAVPPIKAFDTQGMVIYLGTFSKIFSPGIRLGWAAAPADVINKLILFKQGADQMSSSLSQMLAFEAGKRGLIEKQITVATTNLKRKRDITLNALAKYFGDSAKWTVSEGGYYTWVQLDRDVNTFDLLKQAVKDYRVAYVAGPSFFVDRSGGNCLRVCYSLPKENQIEEGIKRLSQVFWG